MEETTIQEIILHKVGNKHHEEPLFISPIPLQIDEVLEDILPDYFLSPFKTDEYFHFFHDDELTQNKVYRSVQEIFNDPEKLYEQSVTLAEYLYEQSNHPKIKSGEFCVVYFNDYYVNNESVDAIGLFKSENKDTFLKVSSSGKNFDMKAEKGINIHKLDKGCLIFNLEQENGYIVAVVDNTNKGADAHYWIDDFLNIRQRQDEYYNTQNVLTLTKQFITQELPRQFDVSKADQADLLNRSVDFFKKNESFNFEEFSNDVIVQKEVIDSFERFKSDYQKESQLEIVDAFDISDSAVKKQARVFKSVIKLDKNFHIYVHGNRELIEQGVDEKGRKYYKIFYQEEQ